MPDPIGSIDKAVVEGLNQRIEAELVRALSGDEVIGRYVAAALNRKPDGSYGRETFLNKLLSEAISDASAAALRAILEDERPAIERECRKALRAAVPKLVDAFIDGQAKAAASSWLRISVSFDPRDG